MSISFEIGECPECGFSHGHDLLHFLIYSGWIEMEGSTEESPKVGLNPLIVDALFRTNAEIDTVDVIESMLFDDTITTWQEMHDDDDEEEEEHPKPVLTIVKNEEKIP